jgi:trehalose 6-phosphate phosphatase
MMHPYRPESLEPIRDGSCPVLLATDFDGTLCRIAPNPEMVFVPDRIREVLREISEERRVVTAVISGRTLADVESRVGLPLIYGGNHGLEIRGPGINFVHEEAAGMVDQLDEACREVAKAVQEWDGAWVENKRLTATVHFRNVAPADQHQVALSTRRAMAQFGTAFCLRSGRRALEIRPNVQWGKGAALRYIRDLLGFGSARCVCLGDDVTDESMFRELPLETTIRVGWHGSSAAHYYVRDTDAVVDVLEQLLVALREPASDPVPA